MLLAFGSDHAGLQLKRILVEYAAQQGHECTDHGTDSDASCDYPDFAHAVARAVQAGDAERGILVCGTGLGVSMAANKHPGIRAAVCREEVSARLSRAHNDANVLCLGGRVTAAEYAKAILDVWLATDFEGGRHSPRVAKIDAGAGDKTGA